MISKTLIYLIRLYQRILSPDRGYFRFFLPKQGGHCVMYPSCSEYMILAIKKHGVLRGMLKGLRRISRCHPYQKRLVDFP